MALNVLRLAAYLILRLAFYIVTFKSYYNNVPTIHSIKILFVLNPVSGGQSKANWETFLTTYMKDKGLDFEVFHTTGKADRESIRHYVKTLHPERVVAVGGDGTLKLVAEILAGTNIPLGIIPAGSANGMARELGISFDEEEAMDTILNGVIRKIDGIRVNTQDLCLHLSDIGMNAQLVKYFEDRGIRGMFGYVRGVFKMLLRRRLLQVTIRDGKHIIEREAFMVVLANARMYGTGAMINPEGDLSDGFFEVVIIKRMSPGTLLKMFFQKKSFNENKLEIIQVQQVDIEVQRRAYFQVDGEYKGKMKHIKAKIEKQVLHILLPPDVNP
jgi:diacylglycerol kinase (ATP)